MYDSLDKLASNNFAYEYQLRQLVNGKRMINIGTPSVEYIQVVSYSSEPHKVQYSLSIKFHYCPNGRDDYPGKGEVNLVPNRDFVDR